MKNKVCTNCKKRKNLSEFYKVRKNETKVRSICKKCSDIYNKHYVLNNKENIQQYKRLWGKKNKDAKRAYDKIWRKQNKKRLLKLKKEYHQKRKQIDFRFHLLTNLRNRLNMALKKHSKGFSTMFLIGCEIDYLMYHLQERFTKGM